MRNFGVSNQTPGQMELLKRSVKQPLVVQPGAAQHHARAAHRAGLAANMAGLDQSIYRDNGILDYSRLNDITLQAWSPFQKGFFDGVFIGDRENYAELNDVLDEIAAAARRDAHRDRRRLDHPASREHAGRARNDQAGARAGVGGGLRRSRSRREEWYRLFTTAGHILP